MRRILLPHLSLGQSTLPAPATHHLRDVLRLEPGETIEVFDPAGHIASAIILAINPDVLIQIDQISQAPAAPQIAIASALPKGPRADWMIEKLAELGIEQFFPLQTERSVVLPKGQKFERWQRLAESAAEQSGRAGVMRIAPSLIDLPTLLTQSADRPRLYLSPLAAAAPILQCLPAPNPLLFIGPEGGWTDGELALFQRHHVPAARLTATILRIETAAVAAAAAAALAANLTTAPTPATITPRT